MHLQVRASVPKSGMTIEGEEGEDGAISATYRAGALVEMLAFLKSKGFNLRAAGGSQIEFGGEFTFWVDGRSADEDHDQAAHAARRLLVKEGWAAQVYEVRAEHLTDESGTLLDFVERVTADGLLIQDIHVGTKDAEGIPVQIFAVSVPPAG